MSFLIIALTVQLDKLNKIKKNTIFKNHKYVSYTIQVLKSAKLINCSLNRSFKKSNRMGLVLGNSSGLSVLAGRLHMS